MKNKKTKKPTAKELTIACTLMAIFTEYQKYLDPIARPWCFQKWLEENADAAAKCCNYSREWKREKALVKKFSPVELSRIEKLKVAKCKS